MQSKSKSPKVKKSKKVVEKTQIKSKQSETSPDSKVHSIDPVAMKESEMAISKLVEHSESLGNSFEILTNRLQSREEQLVKLSTSNADLLAQNDDLKSQLDFLNERDQINSKELKNMKALEKEHQVRWRSFYVFRTHYSDTCGPILMIFFGFIELTPNWCNVIFSTSVSNVKPEVSCFSRTGSSKFRNQKSKIF